MNDLPSASASALEFRPARGVLRFVLATLAHAASTMLVNLVLAPLNPFEGESGGAFFRLFLAASMLVGPAFVFLIQDSRFRGLKLFGLSLLAYVGVAQLLQHVETLAFNFMFGFGPRELLFLVVSQALGALVFVPLAMLVAGTWKASAGLPPDRLGSFLPAGRGTFLRRLLLLGVLWYFCYMLAGYLIADPITHDYYLAKNPELPAINAWLPFLQFFRGLAWALLLLLGARIMNRPAREAGLLVGLVYGVFHAASLLLPSPFMPAEMRLSHLPEIVVSLVLFGSLAVSVMGRRKAGPAAAPAAATPERPVAR